MVSHFCDKVIKDHKRLCLLSQVLLSPPSLFSLFLSFSSLPHFHSPSLPLLSFHAFITLGEASCHDMRQPCGEAHVARNWNFWPTASEEQGWPPTMRVSLEVGLTAPARPCDCYSSNSLTAVSWGNLSLNHPAKLLLYARPSETMWVNACGWSCNL